MVSFLRRMAVGDMTMHLLPLPTPKKRRKILQVTKESVDLRFSFFCK